MTDTKTQHDALPTGSLPYTMTNDYMFRAVLQKNTHALKGFLYALLSLPEESIQSVEILNPIQLGETINDKTCVLDIKIRLNHDQIINIEMQVHDLGNWPERSLTYLCRSFDNLQKGEDYINVRTTIHIGIVNFDIPGLTPEFYSEFKLMNTKNHEVYSDKFILRVLNLNVLKDASTKMNLTDLYDWAKLLKATTWEELDMLAKKNTYIEDTVVTFRQMTEDEKIREQCEAREKYNWDMASAIAKGKSEGYAEGKSEGEKRLATLINILIQNGLSDEIPKVTTDSEYREALYKQYKL